MFVFLQMQYNRRTKIKQKDENKKKVLQNRT